ncbi:DNA mismatch repair protein [Pseudoflavitalea sp. G-6-1-2]|uniref:MutS-related protein n=1 Tax=Pseudoflavitalea sp. G-6-1-2 TaxID=2728841 RepID=UPI00146B0AA9|nr:DNA mismatch repair protein [Pseudoflavitalea sp. G-6-1-2]NML22279.1 DNA mismatch repair protein [Pseudoflavitalea sp. G-6-1-2]
MSLIIDKQTLDDLNIFGKRDNDAVYAIFNRTHTRGGAGILEQLFRYPLANLDAIKSRSSTIRFFLAQQIKFPFRGELLDAAANYLSDTDERSRMSAQDNTLSRKFNQVIGADTGNQQLMKGIASIIEIFILLKQFVDTVNEAALETPYAAEISAVKQVLLQQPFEQLLQEKVPVKIDYEKAADYDRLLRFVHIEDVKKILEAVYMLDVYISVASVAAARGFAFAEPVGSEEHVMEIEGLYHPKLSEPIANDIEMKPNSNIVFLTGANMAGKSTFMKSLGIAVFLAHVGFPVPASRMRFSVCDGLLTTINLPDNLNMGYSHFYTEVLRVKKMAAELEHAKNLFIIFDELFRGTNVKDAYDATVAITSAFASRPNCMFVVSTHIMEAGEKLMEECSNIQFVYLPTLMNGDRPVYPRKLQQGITSDRHGMVIIHNEGILDILRNGQY